MATNQFATRRQLLDLQRLCPKLLPARLKARFEAGNPRRLTLVQAAKLLRQVSVVQGGPVQVCTFLTNHALNQEVATPAPVALALTSAVYLRNELTTLR